MKILSAAFAALLLCIQPAKAGMVTLSAFSKGTSQPVDLQLEQPWGLWSGVNDICIDNQPSGLTVNVNGAEYSQDCKDASWDNINSPYKYIKDNVTVYATNTSTVDANINVHFYEYNMINHSEWGSLTIHVPAGHKVSVQIQNSLSVTLNKNEKKDVELSVPSMVGGTLTFTPTKTNGKEGEITSGNNAIGYNIPGGRWDGKAWEVNNDDRSYVLEFNPDHDTLVQGIYEGTVEAKLSVP